MKDFKDYIVEGILDNKLLKPLRDFIQKNFKKKVGFKEMVTIGIQGDRYDFTATVDTGNGGVVPTLGVDKMNVDDDKVIITIGDKEYTFDKKGEASPTVGNVIHHRPIIIIDYIKIGGRRLDEPFIAVTDERKKSTKTLINRDTMSKLNLIVDPSKNNIIHEKLKIDKNIKFNIDVNELKKYKNEIDEVYKIICEFYEKHNIYNDINFTIDVVSKKINEFLFKIKFIENQIKISDLKYCLNDGAIELCKYIDKETGYYYVWSPNYSQAILKLYKDKS